MIESQSIVQGPYYQIMNNGPVVLISKHFYLTNLYGELGRCINEISEILVH